MTIRRLLLSALLLLGLVACHGTHDHGSGNHDHGSGDHHHGEAESWAVTAWGEHFELFPEIDALVAGQASGAHVHVTILEGFQPATNGEVSIVLVDASGQEERFTSSNVVRPGIFNVDVIPTTTGNRELRFDVRVDGVAETIAGGTVQVGDAASPGGLLTTPHPGSDGAGGDEVDFLKEQQWRTTFATAWAAAGSLNRSVRGSARLEPPSGGQVVMTSPVDGMVRAGAWPHTGQSVSTGQSLLEVIPSVGADRSLATLEAQVRELEARSGAAGTRVQRLDELLAQQAVSRKDVEDARADFTTLAARLSAARAELAATESSRLGGPGASAIPVRAPFAGRVASVLVSPGEHVATGNALLRVVREEPIWAHLAVVPAEASLLPGGIAGLILDTGASSAPVEIEAGRVRLVALAPEVDARTGSVEAILEIQATVDVLRPGLRATAEVLLPETIDGILLPDSSVIDDAGVPVVYVQTEGESFVRRDIQVRHRQGDSVLVDGVMPGERVVTIGGAAIRRASLLASGSVEGHVH